MKHSVACLVLIVTLSGCGSKEGNPDVYNRIASLTDCSELQREFDIADSNNQTDYMKAADERMREVGCYG